MADAVGVGMKQAKIAREPSVAHQTLGDLVADTYDHVARFTIPNSLTTSRTVASILHRQFEGTPRLHRMLFSE
jgi:hypothetical protein